MQPLQSCTCMVELRPWQDAASVLKKFGYSTVDLLSRIDEDFRTNMQDTTVCLNTHDLAAIHVV